MRTHKDIGIFIAALLLVCFFLDLALVLPDVVGAASHSDNLGGFQLSRGGFNDMHMDLNEFQDFARAAMQRAKELSEIPLNEPEYIDTTRWIGD
ncbi:cytochrome b [Acrasis kona]|uniref:Cytochrome b n=1 Tax=Acrasis kona TaxID=1008807 RepID=A0AAW2YQ90_9EUKA